MSVKDTITLYRGDSYEIEEFSFEKTKRTCLVGQGIYLTNTESVANTYRSKGVRRRDWSRNIHTTRDVSLFSAAVANRDVAKERAFAFFCGEHGIYHRDIHDSRYKDRVSKLRVMYNRLIGDGLIKIEYSGTRVVDSEYLKKENVKPTGSAGRANTWFVRNLTVTWFRPDIELFGHISVFRFPKRPFNDSMFNLAATSYDRELLGMFYDAGCEFGDPYSDRDSYIRANTWVNWRGKRVSNFNKGHWSKMRHILEPIGYRGFEYPGGVHTGSATRHRAFCVWDDEWVNAHNVVAERH